MNRSLNRISHTTAGVLIAAAGLHVAWGQGSSFPFRSHADLMDNVVGSPASPSPRACYGVAAVLGAIATAVLVKPRRSWHRRLLQVVALGFAGRASAGFAGRTDVLVPGSSSDRFRRRDRQIYAPLCALLSAGVVSASVRSA